MDPLPCPARPCRGRSVLGTWHAWPLACVRALSLGAVIPVQLSDLSLTVRVSHVHGDSSHQSDGSKGVLNPERHCAQGLLPAQVPTQPALVTVRFLRPGLQPPDRSPSLESVYHPIPLPDFGWLMGRGQHTERPPAGTGVGGRQLWKEQGSPFPRVSLGSTPARSRWR